MSSAIRNTPLSNVYLRNRLNHTITMKHSYLDRLQMYIAKQQIPHNSLAVRDKIIYRFPEMIGLFPDYLSVTIYVQSFLGNIPQLAALEVVYGRGQPWSDWSDSIRCAVEGILVNKCTPFPAAKQI